MVIWEKVADNAVEIKNHQTRYRLITSRDDRTAYFTTVAYYICTRYARERPAQEWPIPSLPEERAPEALRRGEGIGEIIDEINDTTRFRGLNYTDIQCVWRNIPNSDQKPYRLILSLRHILGLSPGNTRKRLQYSIDAAWSRSKFSREFSKASNLFNVRYVEKLLEKTTDLHLVAEPHTLTTYLDTIPNVPEDTRSWAEEIHVKGRSPYDVIANAKCSKEEGKRLIEEADNLLKRARSRLTEMIQIHYEARGNSSPMIGRDVTLEYNDEYP